MAYSKNTWATGDVITAEKLNSIENAVGNVSSSIDSLTPSIARIDNIENTIESINSEIASARNYNSAGTANTLGGRIDELVRISNTQPGGNNEIWVNSGNGVVETEVPTYQEFNKLKNSNAPEYSNNAIYAVGEYVFHNGNLYKCKTAITTAETWNDAHWEQVVFGSEVRDVKSAYADLDETVDDRTLYYTINLYNPALQTSDTISPHYYVNGVPYSTTQFDGSYNCTALIPVKPNTKYTIGLVGATPVNPWNTATQRGWSYDKDGNYISDSNWESNTFTTPSNAAYIRFNYYISAGTVDLTKLNTYCMLVEGETLPDEYVAYDTHTVKDEIEELTTRVETVESAIEGVDFDEIEDRLDDAEDAIADLEEMVTEYSVNLYDPSLQTSQTISPHYWVNGAPYSTTQFDGSYNCTAPIPVKPNTTYTVGLVGASITNPWNTAGQRGWSFDADGNYISDSNWSSNTFTTPANAAYIRFNYYIAGGTVSLNGLNTYCMLVEGSSLPETYTPYYVKSITDIVNEKANYPIRAIVNSDSNAVFAISKYSTQYDQMIKVGIGGGNGLVDFRGLYTIANGTDDISADGSSAVAYLESGGDWHAPFIVAADQNADGDQPSNEYFTGGNHQYNNTGSGSTPTARVSNIKFILDGRELSAGDNKCGRVLEIRWNNYVQAYNTTKSDGTGREVLKEEHRLIFDGRTWESYVSLIPLEDITIKTWYGFQLMGLNTVFQTIRYIGATNRGKYVYTTSSNCGDSKTNEIMCYGTTHKAILRIDPTYDLGDFAHIGSNKSLFTETYGKAYGYLLSATACADDEIWSAHATYIFEPVS